MYTTFEQAAENRLVKGPALKTLSFDKIRDLLKDFAKTVYGKELCESLYPTSDLKRAKEWQSQTQDSIFVYMKKGSLPISGLPDIRPWLQAVHAGGSLSPKEFLEIGSFLKSVEQIVRFGKTAEESCPENVFAKQAAALFFPAYLEAEIHRCIKTEDELHERASDRLYSLSRQIRDKQSGIRVILNRIVRNHPDALQDQLITLREGRFVVPVKAERRGDVPGVVHDMSSSGQTIFIEPISVVELNNDIRELTMQKKEEIQRILSELSSLTESSRNELLSDISMIGELDFLAAKAAFSYSIEGTQPDINDEGIIHLRRARHPLISKDKVVPIDFSIGEKYRSLVVTGPNTGGKTVSLKTCGLFSLMAMAGLQIPCLDHSRVSVFQKVLADIGDEQSIEQSLSTFSSHMKNLVSILSEANERSLVLVDELGSGTDPSEGAALAIAILEELREKGVLTVATTHYKELKSYAVETEQVENACCEFDTETLSPTYRLLIGMPGVSNAFQISGKLGLSQRIIEKAKTNLSKEGLKVEELLASAERTNRESEKNKAEIRQVRAYVKEQEAKIQKEMDILEEKRQKILLQAQKEKKDLLEDAYEEVREMLDEVKAVLDKENKETAQQRLFQIRSNLRAGLNDLEAPVTQEIKEVAFGKKPDKIVLGQQYEAPLLGISGTAVKGPDSKGCYILENGSVRLSVQADALHNPRPGNKAVASEGKSGKRKAPGTIQNAQKIKASRAASLMPEIKLLGMTAEQAVISLDRYLDDCVLGNIATIRIVHGKGTGALRSAVAFHLRQDKRVKTFRLGTYGEGEDGVTIAELKP